MIARHWIGTAKPECAERYLAHLQTDTFPNLARLPGFLGASVHRRDVPLGVEFRVVTEWQTLDAISAFAGPDISQAVIPAEVEEMMVEYDHTAVHYESVAADPS